MKQDIYTTNYYHCYGIYDVYYSTQSEVSSRIKTLIMRLNLAEAFSD
ncbi:MAG: hypothetical protein QNJ47_03080 [Nostocaceae cyanobacterium]|nr:hypothetical protein [Nostocaceae cyanobacterium]